jgi:Zn-dependent peptidase ImmA (M78 family)
VKKRTWKDLETEANATLDHFVRRLQELGRDVPAMPPVPVRDICALRARPLSINPISDLRYEDKKLAGMLDPRERAISIEARDILGRQRFSIAHELGHYELHWVPFQVSQAIPPLFPIDKFVDEAFAWYFRCTDEDMKQQKAVMENEPIEPDVVIDQTVHRVREVEANQFASFLLMPEDMVREWAKRLRGDQYRLAYQFEVSRAAMHWRLTNLKMRMRDEEIRAQKHFILHLPDSLSQPPPDGRDPDAAESAEFDQPPAIIVTPESRLRTLISEVDTIERAYDDILLDLSPLEIGELGAIGPTQALDLVLLNDYILHYIIPMRTIATESFNLTVRLPTATSYVTRHLSRLGVFEHLRLGSSHQLVDFLPREHDTASGSHILTRLTSIQAGVDVEEIAQLASESLLSWAGQSTSLQEFADFAGLVASSLSQHVIEHSGTRPGSGKGYIAAQLERMVHDGQVTSYQVVIAVGDIGIGVRNSLTQTGGVVADSDFEALRGYLDGPIMSQLRTAITHDWHGHLQLNSGDAMLGVGDRGTSHLTGLYRVPGLQVTVLIACQL